MPCHFTTPPLPAFSLPTPLSIATFHTSQLHDSHKIHPLRPSNPSPHPTITTTSMNNNRRSNINRASRQTNRRPAQPSNQSNSPNSPDLFSSADHDPNPSNPGTNKPTPDKPPDSAGAPRRGRTKRRVPSSRTRSDRKDVADNRPRFHSDHAIEEVDTDIDDEKGLEPDVDDGFYARYRKENDADRSVPSLSGYDTLDPDVDDMSEGGREAKGKMPAKRVDRKMAENAFDAVDRLFEDIAAKGETARRGGRVRDRRGGKQMNREKWLADVKARAATRGGERDDDSGALDVDATEEWDGVVERGEVRKESNGKMAGEKGRSDRGHEEAENGDWEGSQWGTGGTEYSGRRRQRHVSFNNEAMFQNLIKIARQGPRPGSRVRRKDSNSSVRNAGQNRAGGGSSTARGDTQGKSQDSRAGRLGWDDRAAPRKPDVTRLLGITKQMADDEKEETFQKRSANADEDDAGEQSTPAEALQRLQRFTTVRRVGGRSHRIYKAPEEWQPLSEIDVAQVRSDSRAFTKNTSRGKGVVAECRACRGTGLEPCVACQGSGWIPPLNDNSVRGKRRIILEKMWMRPNLVVDKTGEAQCVRCNGIGKQFCARCNGSGLANKKGFSFADMRDIFDIFPDADESYPEDEFVGEDYASSDDEEVAEDVDEFQLYRGGLETEDDDENGSSKQLDVEENDMESEVEVLGEDMDVEDESAELLAALKAMHLADLEESDDDSELDFIGRRSLRRHDDEMVQSVVIDDIENNGVDIDDEDESDVLESVDDEIDVEEEDDDFQIFLEDGEDDEDDEDDSHSDDEPDEDPFSDGVNDDSWRQ